MKSDDYGIIFLLPPVIVCYVPMMALFVMMKRYRPQLDRISRCVVTNAFSDIFKMKKKKTCCPRGTQWLFKEVNLTEKEAILSKVRTRFLILFITMLSAVLNTFWQLLVRDVSYDCDEDDFTKDCFERKYTWESLDPLNCSSATVQDLIRNGTIQVIYNKIVFNFGLATGVGYGSLRLSLFSINVGTSLMLKIKETKTLRCVQGIGVFLLLCAMTSLIVVASVIPSVDRFLTDNLSAAAQIMVTAVTAMVFLCLIPWKEIID
ncbi:uncharacterized protein LOC111329340 [Stylophora pistillata]|nr:uncharacterized protein LOC111329340 [Stylophora pistillata]